MKAAFFAHRVHAAHIQLGTANGQDDARQAATRTHIQHFGGLTVGVAHQWRHRRQAVEQVVREHLLRVAHGRQVVNPVPFLDQGQVAQQPFQLGIAQAQAEFGRPRLQDRERISHAAWLSSAGERKPLKPPFFRWISNREIVAGVMPEMREAWPSVSGRCLASFWRASIDRAVTCM